MADVKISALPAASALATTDVVPVVQASTTKQATMTQVATSVFGQNGVVSSLPAAGTLLTTDVTNVVAGGVASQASMTQIATSVYGNNAALTGLANASSVTATDTTVVAQSGTNREATVLQVSANIYADNTTLSALTTNNPTTNTNAGTTFFHSAFGSTNSKTSASSYSQFTNNVYFPSNSVGNTAGDTFSMSVAGVRTYGFPYQSYVAFKNGLATTPTRNVRVEPYNIFSNFGQVVAIAANVNLVSPAAAYTFEPLSGAGVNSQLALWPTDGCFIVVPSKYAKTVGNTPITPTLPTGGSYAKFSIFSSVYSTTTNVINLQNYNTATLTNFDISGTALDERPVYKFPFELAGVYGPEYIVNSGSITSTSFTAGSRVMTVNTYSLAYALDVGTTIANAALPGGSSTITAFGTGYGGTGTYYLADAATSTSSAVTSTATFNVSTRYCGRENGSLCINDGAGTFYWQLQVTNRDYTGSSTSCLVDVYVVSAGVNPPVGYYTL